MNEVSPHYNWARKICNRANAFGVLSNKFSCNDLFDEDGINYED